MKKKPLLSDHRKVGKRFIPPLLQLSEFSFISWIDCTLPELIWQGLLIDKFGLNKGGQLAISLAELANEVSLDTHKRWYAPISAYSFLTSQVREAIVESLKVSGELDMLLEGLNPLFVLYPECPLSFLNQGDSAIKCDINLLNKYKELLTVFYNKREYIPTLIQANSIYIAFATDMLKIMEGVTSFDNFPEIAKFPETEESKRIALSIYAEINTFMAIFLEENFHKKYTVWSQYFWHRGLELEPCTLEKIYGYYYDK